ncbi:MAG: hypothetical protein KF694_08655 [Mesorhizobium sp.]|nr:hypothetical protein [Mesorhizobium sp.]
MIEAWKRSLPIQPDDKLEGELTQEPKLSGHNAHFTDIEGTFAFRLLAAVPMGKGAVFGSLVAGHPPAR